jgi:Zn-dependent M16 (insulinase) family peptidase
MIVSLFIYIYVFGRFIYTLLIDVKSYFVKISAHISASTIPSHLLPYTRLFLKAIFSLPIEKEDGTLMDYEDVVKGLGEDTVEYTASLGTNFGFREMVVFNLKAKAAKFEKCIQWLQDIMWNTKFTAERLKIVASQILNDIPQAKRDGHDVSCYFILFIRSFNHKR